MISCLSRYAKKNLTLHHYFLEVIALQIEGLQMGLCCLVMELAHGWPVTRVATSSSFGELDFLINSH